MKTHIAFWIAVIILAIIICILLYKNGSIKYIESMRTVPQSIIHSDDKYTPPPVGATEINIKPGGLNEDVDEFIKYYFNKNQIPYIDTIDLYKKYCVNNGNLDTKLKLKLIDLCYYFIEIVIPNIPSVDNPKPEIKWPRIEWISKDWNAYNYSFNENAIANYNLLDKLNKKYKGKKSKEDEDNEYDEDDGILKTSGGSSNLHLRTRSFRDQDDNSNNNNNNNNNNGNNSSSCNSSCPTACDNIMNRNSSKTSSSLSDLAKKMSDTKKTTEDDKKTKKNKKYVYDYSEEVPDSGQYNKLNLNSNLNNDPKRLLYIVEITDEPNNSDSTALNDYVKNKIIDIWFDTASDAIRPMPSKYAQNMFTLYTQGRAFIDRNHKNKLRDLAYYFMENIIPGLPTKEKPRSYVEWKPLRFLANSDL